MSLIKISAFDRVVLDKYKTGGVLINSVIKPKVRSLAFLIQKFSAPFKVKEPVADHVADVIMINGIPHAQTILKTDEGKKGWMFWKTVNNYRTGTVLLYEYLAFYDPNKVNIYFCSLSENVNAVFKEDIYITKKEEIEGRLYDKVWRFIMTALDDIHVDKLDKYLKFLPFYKAWIPNVLKWLFTNSETASRITCSAGLSYKQVGSFLEKFNYSEDTPQNIAEKKIFNETNYLIQGNTLKQLYQFNAKEVTLIK